MLLGHETFAFVVLLEKQTVAQLAKKFLGVDETQMIITVSYLKPAESSSNPYRFGPSKESVLVKGHQ